MRNRTGAFFVTLEVDESEVKPGKYKLIGYWRDPNFQMFYNRMFQNGGDVLICPTCIQHHFVQKGIIECWLAGHFDIPIYEEI
jgi:hypothetical protein